MASRGERRRDRSAWVALLGAVLACSGRSETRSAPDAEDAGRGGNADSNAGTTGASPGGAGPASTAGGSGDSGTGEGARAGTGGQRATGGGDTTGGVQGDGGSEPSEAGETGSAGDGGSAATQVSGAGGDAPTTGGAAGEPSVVPGPLTGHYDVFLDGFPPSVPGCTATFQEPRWNLSIVELNGSIRAHSFKDFDYLGFDATTVELAGSRLEIPPRASLNPFADASPTLSLLVVENRIEEHGGEAVIAYDCGAISSVERRVPVSVLPDLTAPRVRLDPTIGAKRGPVFGFTEFAHRFSEPVTFSDGSYDTTLRDLAVAAETMALRDVTRSENFETEWLFALGGPVALQRFVEPNDALGLHATPVILDDPADAAGNAAFPAVQSLNVIAGASLPLDFDVADGTGGYGDVTYYPPGAADSPCEEGGCLAIDAYTEPCSSNDDAPTGLGLTLPAEDVTYRMRLRTLTNGAATTTVQVLYPGGCTGEHVVSSPTALATPTNGYTHASEWTDRELSLCGGPDRDRGVIVVPGCAPAPGTPGAQKARLIIERVVRVD